jgi:hypothetical protein
MLSSAEKATTGQKTLKTIISQLKLKKQKHLSITSKNDNDEIVQYCKT